MDLKFSAVTRPVERLMATAQNGLEVLRLGGLETGNSPSPSQTVESTSMYKLRRYFPPDSRPGHPQAGQPVLLVHPMMMSANMWDVTREDGAVGILHAAGLDPWVIDFGSPDEIEGGMRRNLADHIVALSEALDIVADVTGRDVHLTGYSQGGMFCYQVAAYRRSKSIASIVTFGSPVDTLAALPMGLPPSWQTTSSIGWISRVGWRAPASRCSIRSRPPRRGSTSFVNFTIAKRCCPGKPSADSSSRRAGSPGPDRRFPSCSSSSSRTTG
jgi:putative long chain acyl-CoA synthase